MFVRSSGSGNEYKRIDNSFYRGVIVKNNDPLKINRVKVFIPELSNQPYDDWFEAFESFYLRSPGNNVNITGDSLGSWKDTEIFEKVCLSIPWAEPCFPVLGESGDFRYYKDGKISTISDCNYPEGFEKINTEYPTIQDGSFSPAFLYENETTAFGDAFQNPTSNFTIKGNAYAYSYRPSKFVNKAKGSFSTPEIGSKVWVFHYQGDLNFPIYFGVYRDYRELSLINDTDNAQKISSKYPSDFDN